MQLMQTSDAARLAGVTVHQLREWCTRRDILSPDVPGAGRGRHALFSWQTVLAVRLLHELNERFGIEVGAWRGAIREFRAIIGGRPFPVLWHAYAQFSDCGHAVVTASPPVDGNTVVVVPLAPHLQAIAQDFALPPEPQLPLFPAVGLRR
ncbi:MerR family transcriptional regulator [Mesorhizobium sp. M2D.F.Ca.ET.223.01.1.1]|nr:MerR family transcriptional regulator [Mesorhizobium sp. M2D.F.Ca.ET.223.01.1.1]TGT70850.1 MerR family transcriptional regulator [bacterium M00.F.Ca.ET.159.01.1.1]TGT82493.1 MerR family transcriptional regulator [bacterium M00.F.Ca.ET.157.01.1.1]